MSKKIRKWIKNKKTELKENYLIENYKLIEQDGQSIPSGPMKMNTVISGVKDDKKILGTQAWSALQKLYDLLKVLAEKNPNKLMQIVRIMDQQLKNDPEVAPLLSGIMSGARKIINNVGDQG
jgi:predicted RNA polymerase sigma factor